MQKRWSKTEISHLKRHSDQSLEELAQRLHTDTETVRRKMEELGLIQRADDVDEALEVFTRALESLHDGKWQEAAGLFGKVVAEADSRHLADRARQYLNVCQRQIAESADTDPYLQAVYEKNRGNLDAAFAICRDHGSEDDERFVYLKASLLALQGANEEALTHLKKAIQMEPKNRVHAFHDPDFTELRGEEGFSGLVASAS